MKPIKILIIFTSILATLGCLQKTRLPEVTFPEPTGSFSVGTRYLYFVDKQRPEIFTVDPSDFREITVQVWYPSEKAENVPYAPYIKGGNDSVQELDLPSYYTDLKSHSKIDIPISRVEKDFPVLIFNHGWGEHFAQNTILMEELASHGFIVFSLAHHHEARFSFYPDGRSITFDPENQSDLFRRIMQEQQDPEARQVFKKMFSAQTTGEQESVFQRGSQLLPSLLVKGPRLWADDIIFFMDQLERLNEQDAQLAGKLNLEKIGVFGMSMGGIATCQACLKDERIKAGINMDGGIYGDVYYSKILQPFMFVNTVRYQRYEEVFLKRLQNSGIVVTIPDADHYNLHDVSILDPSHIMLGTADGQKVLTILNEYTLAFFNRFLKGIKIEDMFDPDSPKHKEISVAVKNM